MKTRKALAVLLSLAISIMMFASLGTMTVSAISAWAPNTAYAIGDQVTYNGSTYQCLQAHTSLVGWEPPNAPALWQLVTGGSTPTPAPTATPTPTPASTATPTPTPVATATPTPTPAATATPTPAATATATPAPTATPTPAATATPTPTATPSGYPAWNSTTAYNGGAIVSYNGSLWQAKWWTQGETPGVADVWALYSAGPTATPGPTSTPAPTPTQGPTPTPIPSSGYQRIGYLAGWASWDASTIQGSKLTIINYAFAAISNGTVTGGDSTKFAALRTLKTNNPGLRTEISIGGWGAEGFHAAASTDASRNTFADSAVSFMKTNGFDGVDLDWEYPNQGGSGIQYGPEDKHNFTLLLQTLRSKLDAQGTTDGKHYLLTIAAGSNQTYIDNTEMNIVQQYVDYINLMTYDLHGGWDGKTGHHTALYTSPSDPNGPSVNQAVTLFKNNGVPASKLVVGCAFYGHQWNGVTNANNGLWEPGSDGGTPGFSSISTLVNANGYTRYWDSSAHAPYLFNGSTFISYDDEQSIADKCAYVKSNGLGGAMFWEYSQDTSSGTLLNAFYNGLK